jgi:hypothetical protein
MKICIAAILLALSVAGRLSAAVADDRVDAIIRLPSHGNDCHCASFTLFDSVLYTSGKRGFNPGWQRPLVKGHQPGQRNWD